MTTKTAPSHAEGVAPAPTLRAESEAIYAAAAAGALGAIYGLIVALIAPDMPLADTTGAFGLFAAIGAGVDRRRRIGHRLLAVAEPPGPGVAQVAARRGSSRSTRSRS